MSFDELEDMYAGLAEALRLKTAKAAAHWCLRYEHYAHPYLSEWAPEYLYRLKNWRARRNE